jgi:pimeloyl-ACP methyl ester carboxylesterase
MRHSYYRTAVVMALGAVVLAACGDAEPSVTADSSRTTDEVATPSSPAEPETTAASTEPASTTADAARSDVIDGMFDVGGHQLYLHCEGTGSPTIVYLHGSIKDPGPQPVSNARRIQDEISDTNRFCAYDRRNVGRSETVDAVQTPDALLSDLRGVLDAAAIEPPYVLLGASFGGLPAYVYANTYPDEVVGMVLLDSMFPDELSLEYLFPLEDRYEAFDTEDENDSLERISHYDMQMAAQPFIGDEPDIPLIYLASEQEPWDEQGWGVPEYDAQILDVQAGFVDRFAPGELIWVDSPHFMEPVVPTEIASALRTVIERSLVD